MRRLRFWFAPAILTALLASAFSLSLRADDEIKATPVWTEKFENNDRGWIGENTSPDWSGKVIGGVLLWENRHASNVQATLMSVVVSQKRHPEYSIDVHFRSTDTKGEVGIQWGTSGDRKNFLYYYVSPDRRFRIGRCTDGNLADAKSGDAGKAFRRDELNRLVIRVLGERSAFFLNGAVLWIGPTENPPGSMFGPSATPGGGAELDNLQIGYLRVEESVITARLAAYEAAVGDAGKAFLETPSAAAGSGTLAGFNSERSDKAVSPETLQAWLKEAMELEQKNQYEDAEKLFRKILAQSPEEGPPRVQLAWCLLCRGVFPEAKEHADFCALIDPLGIGANFIAAYACASQGDWAGAERAADRGFFLDYEDTALAEAQKDLNEITRAGHGAAYVERLRTLLAARRAATKSEFGPIGRALVQLLQAQNKGDFAAAEKFAREATTAAAKLPAQHQLIAAYANYIAGYLLNYTDDPRRARPFLEEAYSRMQNAGAAASSYIRVRNAWLLGELSLTLSQPARASEVVASVDTEAIRLPPPAADLKAQLLYVACRATNLLQKTDDLRAHATKLSLVRGTGRDAYYEALAHNFVGASFVKSTLPPDRKRAREEFEQALKSARDGGYQDLASEITANLCLSYWQAGERDRAKKLYLDLASDDELRGNYNGAEVSLNNLAAMQYYVDDFAGAADTLKRAVALTEKARAKLSGEERIHFLAERVSAYQFLTLCLQRAGDPSALFDAMNQFRARSLAETLNLGEPPAPTTLAKFQQSLAGDEAAVFYTLIGPGEIVAQVVTHDGASSIHHTDYPTFVELKKKYLDRLNSGRPGYKPTGPVKGTDGNTYIDRNVAVQIQLDDFDAMVELTRSLIDGSAKAPPEIKAKLLPEFLNAFRSLLVSPLEAKLTGKKKLILFPDGILNFMPFDALPDSPGHYLVERFDVRYCQSAAVWQLLHSRQYPTQDRLPFFAMGGALFSKMEEKAAPADNRARMIDVQLKAHQNIVANRPQREVYAALFGNEPMKFLKGSLIEVRELAKIFPQSTVFTGADMTENRIKAMARDGALKRYRVIHLATHGFAFPEVPELSGVAMSIFPTAQEGEDGYLTAPEIARLGVQADIMVLSACETALGRIYGGEGVAGLTGSLLIGGANRALVSLWPVSDAGTMYFMREMYALTALEGKSYDEAVNIVKRHFIAGKYGDEFRDPQIWAPFVHYGL